jgi:hypothetical protein
MRTRMLGKTRVRPEALDPSCQRGGGRVRVKRAGHRTQQLQRPEDLDERQAGGHCDGNPMARTDAQLAEPVSA